LGQPPIVALLYAAQLLFLEQAQSRLTLGEDLLWPWTVFGSPVSDTLLRIASCGATWLAVEEDTFCCRVDMEALNDMEVF
jgi:hypothetical protein